MKFEDWTLGYADAAKEYLLEPIIFKEAFMIQIKNWTNC